MALYFCSVAARIMLKPCLRQAGSKFSFAAAFGGLELDNCIILVISNYYSELK